MGGVSLAWSLGAGSALWLRTVYDQSRNWLGDGIGAVLGAEMLAAGMVLGPPTFCMGVLFSHVIQAAAASSGGLGRPAALNLLGAALGASCVGLWLLPWLGIKACVLAIGAGYLLLIMAAGGAVKRTDGWAVVIPIVFAGLVLVPSNLRRVELPAGGRVLDYRESPYGAVAVVETSDGHKSLRVNNRLQMGGTAAALAEKRQAHLPLLLHAEPKRALFLGPGTGITLGAAAEHPGLEIDAVELVPEILAMMPAFAPANEGVFTNARVHLQAGDARRFIRSTTEHYDVIVADLFHPAQDGAGFLYTREHFEAVRRRLNSGGVFCQWLPLHQLGVDDLKGIVQTFLQSFPNARAFLLHFNVDIPVLGLVGRAGADWESATVLERMKVPALKEPLRNVGLERPIQFLGSLAGDSVVLARYAGRAPLGTDDRPAVLFFAPYHTVQRQARPSEVLLDFLGSVQDDRPRLVAAVAGPSHEPLRQAQDEASTAQLQGFMEARDLYLQGLVKESSGDFSGAIELYLASTQRSLYFTPSYARCITIIQAMARADRQGARDLYRRLETAQPAQPLAKKLLGPLLEDRPSP